MKASLLLRQLLSYWRPILVVHVVFTLLVITLLAPLFGLLMQAALAMSGTVAVADQDIALLLLSPWGMAGAVIMVGLLLAIAGLELGALQVIAQAALHPVRVKPLQAVLFSLRHAAELFRLTVGLTLRVLAYLIPAVLVFAVLKWYFLNDYDNLLGSDLAAGGGAGIAGFSRSQLCVASLDSPTVLRRDVPAGMIPDAGEHPSQASEPPPRMFSDAKRRRLVVARGNRVAMLDFDQLDVPREPPLVARFDGPPVVFLGKPYEGSLTAEAGIEVVPRELPEGMQLKEGTLSWIPSNAQVGHHRATFELRRGTESASQTITLRVDRQSLRCSFPAAYVDLSNDGRFAVVRARHHDVPRGRAPQGGTEYPVALVDVGEGRVLSERVFHYPWLQAAVDDHYVYALRPASRPIAFKLVVLSRDDLSEIQEFPVRRDDVALRTLRNQYLISEDVRTLPDLEVATSPLGTPIASVAKTGPALYRQLQQRWLVDGVVVDADCRRVELLWGFRPLNQLYFPTVRSLSCSYLSPWSMTRTMQGPAFKLVDDRGNTCKLSAPPLDDSGARTTDAYTTLFSDDSPWLVRVERDRSSGILNLLVYCPVSGEVLGQFPIGPTQGMEVAQNRSPVALSLIHI